MLLNNFLHDNLKHFARHYASPFEGDAYDYITETLRIPLYTSFASPFEGDAYNYSPLLRMCLKLVSSFKWRLPL